MSLKLRSVASVLVLLVICLFAAGAASAYESQPVDALNVPGVSSPGALPNAPFIMISRTGSAVYLKWEHPDSEIIQYQVWRSDESMPYFEPSLQEGTQLDSYSFPKGVYGVGSLFGFLDEGICGYFVAGGSPLPCEPQSPPVTVIGSVDHEYFWVVTGGNADEFASSNRVGAFDFALVKGD